MLSCSHKLASRYHKIESHSHKFESCSHKLGSHNHKLAKSLPQDTSLSPQVSKVITTSFDPNVEAISLSMIPNLYIGHPFTSIQFSFTYSCRPGYHFINFNGYSSKLPN